MSPFINTIGDLAVARTLAAIALRQRRKMGRENRAPFEHPCVVNCARILGVTRGAMRDAMKCVPDTLRDDVAKYIRSRRALARELNEDVGAKRGGVQ